MTQAKSRGQHATTLLTEDHKAVKKLFKEFEKSEQDTQKDKLVKQICMELSLHAQIEEELFYPAAREALKDQDLLDEAEEEHAGIKGVVEELKGMQPGDEHYEAKVKVLSEYVEHHVQEEEDELFPKAKKADIDTPDLAAQLLERKQELMDDPALLEEAAAASSSAPPKARPASAPPR